ncbi:hypothetical protein Msil_2952 [Methylocella silvestris BL2]|uniref:Uncharacterized protein n=1 Tax=Methylocella silvestris (strain DSM 15510 / CIP 108128 / LMG 27833 / NCIMB 13906 / BL2) TaxID=395965 RepID=B8EIP6_METSB|nr:hypothetical protein [Methylocella silvestris]ACK51863.1 hypothetical protein Msil_2952 [Methylocella silvestris BL2]
MTDPLPIHHLRSALEAQRLTAIEELAAKGGAPTLDSLQKLAIIQGALQAIDDEIKAHQVKVGGGGEKPLA